MTDKDYRDPTARLVILDYLAGCDLYTAPEPKIRADLAANGLDLAYDTVRRHLAWLDDQGLLMIGGGLHLAVPTLTQRGLEVASGTVSHPGVARPASV